MYGIAKYYQRILSAYKNCIITLFLCDFIEPKMRPQEFLEKLL